MLFALDEQRVAQAFSSPFPSFVKIMKKFNVSGSYTLVSNTEPFSVCVYIFFIDMYLILFNIDINTKLLNVCHIVENPTPVLSCTSPHLQNRNYASQFKRRMLDCELCPRFKRQKNSHLLWGMGGLCSG